MRCPLEPVPAWWRSTLQHSQDICAEVLKASKVHAFNTKACGQLGRRALPMSKCRCHLLFEQRTLFCILWTPEDCPTGS
eukprot:CAMPEP_0197697502 /NCGR_PEP_ID=MMETSP1338-20131121/118061_1 /TAXON_ID=43686 ORGANISM="Pelagodinium beii, Strain RCC1491" /NCGR_SAMPLE_ID=MMETSP1338 /ASSEMBLY_ACC=CAM_ASM_000754 /LENGTH=78 /DNA_ID=CAMNT_0043280759 /DNA_START=154 /DNA_END=390 /DNA_ORIENTATION=+